MAAGRVSRLRWNALRWLRCVGWPGWIAVALSVACGVVFFSQVEPMREDALRLDAEAAGLGERLASLATNRARAGATPREQLADFGRRFVNDHGIASALARLHAAPRQQGVQLDQAEFKFVSEPAEPLARYSMILPVRGDYRALRRFSRQALRELPGLALEEVSLRRNDSRSAVVEAQVRFILFVRKPAPAPPMGAAP